MVAGASELIRVLDVTVERPRGAGEDLVGEAAIVDGPGQHERSNQRGEDQMGLVGVASGRQLTEAMFITVRAALIGASTCSSAPLNKPGSPV